MFYIFDHFFRGHRQTQTKAALKKNSKKIQCIFELSISIFYTSELKLKCYDTVSLTFPRDFHNMAIMEMVSFPLCSPKAVRS